MDLEAAFKKKLVTEVAPVSEKAWAKIQVKEGMSLEEAKQAFSMFDEPIRKFAEAVEEVQVRDEKTMGVAGDFKIQVSKLLKTLDGTRKQIISEQDTFVRSVNSLAKALKDRITPISVSLDRKISDGVKFMEAERIKKEQALQEAHKKAQAELNERFEGTGQEAPELAPPPVLPESKVSVRSEHGSLYTREEPKVFVDDFLALIKAVAEEKIPTRVLSPERNELKKLAKAGMTSIPGCTIEIEHIPIPRTS